MQCSACGAAWSDDAQFCTRCGAPRRLRCSSCGRENPPGATFCGGCGTRLAAAASPQPAPREAERRNLTVVFADLVGSSGLVASLDPEEYGALVAAYHRLSAAIVSRYEGTIAQFLGDGILAYFGYPTAHEDDAERAVRAGLEIVEGMSGDRSGRGRPLQVRIGIATGLVVATPASQEAAGEPSAVGEALHTAARLQTLAPPGGVLITEATHQLLGGLFECRELGWQELRGFPRSVRVWQVLGESQVESRFEALRPGERTPFVNRRDELAVLLGRWAEAKRQAGQVVLVAGDAGIGKSRLIQAFRQRLGRDGHTVLCLEASSYRQNTPFHPVIRWIERSARLERDEQPRQRLEKLRQWLAADGQKAIAAEDLSSDLSGGRSDDSAEAAFPGERALKFKERLTQTMLGHLSRLAREGPVLFLVEDVHWLDPSTRELVAQVGRMAHDARILVVLTLRPDDLQDADWPGATIVRLDPLTRAHSSALVAGLAPARLPPELVAWILEHTGGIPLFLEELTQTVLETRDEGTSAPPAIPPTLRDFLAARLDRLGPARDVAQTAAVIGRTFAFDLLAAVVPMAQEDLRRALDDLLRTGLIRRHSAEEESYDFKHKLLQEAAYEGLLLSRRSGLHALIARTLEERFPAVTESNPEILAHHWGAAGQAAPAVEYWLRAGQRAGSRSANAEAAGHLRKGLECLATLPETEETLWQALRLLIALGPALIATHGPGAEEVARVYDQALGLCARLPGAAEHFTAHWGWWRVSPNFRVMRERADRLLALAETLRDPGLRLQAHHSQWATLFNLGDQEACVRHIEAGLELYRQDDYRKHAVSYGGHDPKVCACGEHGLSLWLLGHPARARQRVRVAVIWARMLRHGGSMMHAMDIDLMLGRYLRDVRAVRIAAEEMMVFAREHGFADHGAKALLFRGWARALDGELKAGIAEMTEGIERQRQIGTTEDFPVYYEMLAEVMGRAGRAQEGLTLIGEALDLVERNGLLYWRAELYRRRGELLLAGDADLAEAEGDLRKALAVARAQKARSLELRAATSLAGLLARRDQASSAWELIASVLAGFAEGFETSDLREATALRDVLGKTRRGGPRDGSQAGPRAAPA
ncbi:adenylate/guanylate cyclase domain-containing protein [Arenibaculum pallidiluteum]|uniref:adenylate/guanylate cyclase domain-containing protein n=1 Tax=Arenibaculum pallidiluteum TaxID=2812559 RepID=UPI001A9682DD|nr:adenylate/guanylate cyclase domain-containing protein [Arenibaculum pallidiluteum]